MRFFSRLLLPVFFSICLILTASAEKVYDFNATCQQAYDQILSLKLNAGQKLINQAKQQNPDNLIPYYLESYIDFFVLFFNEDPAELKKRLPHFEERLDKLEDGPTNSPFYNYTRSLVYIQEACVEIKFGERWSAGWDFRKAFALIKSNRKNFPTFVPNNIIYGCMQVVAGTIPDNYRWLAGIFGIKGSVNSGMALLNSALNSSDFYAKLFFEESVFYFGYINFYIQNKPDETFKFLQDNDLDLINNHLLAYMATNLALNAKRNDFARQVMDNRNTSADYLQTPVWDFEMGYVNLRHLQVADAAKSFESFLKKFKGHFYVKDACEKLSWCYYLQGNINAANYAREMVLKRGSSETDADKQAYKDAQSERWPDKNLLKARLLSDGGYNAQALAVLKDKSIEDFSDETDQLEFTYRMGRIYDDLGKDELAIKSYNSAIVNGLNRTEYFASRAALQIGMIYERNGAKDSAIVYYKKCLGMANHDYKDSIDQKAKAGLQRCTN